MPIKTLPYPQTHYFSTLICDYLAEDETLRPFYETFPKLENFEKQIHLKEKTFDAHQRHVLVKRVMAQYNDLTLSQVTLSNIDLLKETSTFTITTGHQLNLFTGPLYFLYKIFSTINLSENLKKQYPNYHFVPVFWMATEDHDFEEINYFNFHGKKIKWERKSGGAVGELSTEGLDEVLKVFKKELGESEPAEKLTRLFAEAYLNHKNLADATRYLANELFREYGLVIVDGNDRELKKTFVPFAEKEFSETPSFKTITKTTEKITTLGYAEQVHPREINLFYLKENLRERIIEKEGKYFVNETEIGFTHEEILKELQDFPERFSPNALLRPLYQEVVLPNLCYIGGGGELAYWFQLKDYFESVSVSFPVLLLRNSVLWVPKRLDEKLQKMEVEIDSLFLPQHILKEKFTKQISEIDIDFSKQKESLRQQFENLYILAKETDASFLGAVSAQEKKQINGLDNLEKRLLKAQKRKHSEHLQRLVSIQNELFPKQSLQERRLNFSELYLEHGELLFTVLKNNLDPLEGEFSVITV